MGGPQGFGYGAPFAGSPPMNAQFMPNMNVLAASQQQMLPGAAAGRTVYVGNLPAEASVDELLNLVKFGPIESVRVLPEKSCAFISFLEGSTAAAFHADACVKKLTLHGSELKIGWGRPSPCPQNVLVAVQQNQATRNVYLGQLDESTTEESLRDDLSRFGPIDQVKIVRDKNIGFVHFLSIATAIKVVTTLPSEEGWQSKRVNYGKDRCAYVPKSQQQNQAHNHQAAAMGLAAAASLGYPTTLGYPGPPGFIDESGRTQNAGFSSPGAMGPASAAALSQMGNRTVYLGNIHSETTTEEICNHIRGGILQSIRFIKEKHIAFVTFVDPNAALAFFHLASYSGVMIHNRRLKIGWGKHSGPLSPAIAMAVQSGGSRNVYVGNIDDPDALNEEKLRRDFGDFGEVEQVNALKEKNCVSTVKLIGGCLGQSNTPVLPGLCQFLQHSKRYQGNRSHEESPRLSKCKDRLRQGPMRQSAAQRISKLPQKSKHGAFQRTDASSWRGRRFSRSACSSRGRRCRAKCRFSRGAQRGRSRMIARKLPAG